MYNGLTDNQINDIIKENNLFVTDELKKINKKNFSELDYGITPISNTSDNSFIEEEDEYDDEYYLSEKEYEPLTFDEVNNIIENIKYDCFTKQTMDEIANLLNRKNFFLA